LQLLLDESRHHDDHGADAACAFRRGRATNTLVAIRQGEVIAHYQKLHLYDAFAMQESRLSMPGDRFRRLIDVDGYALA
jgi:predicted amidohydrolase